MCFFWGEIKWRLWNPSDEYLLSIKDINTIPKLVSFMKGFEYKWDIATIFGREVFWDSWQMPDISLATMQGDCEDAAILAVDILGRKIRTDCMMLITGGQYKKDGKICTNAHAVTVIPNNVKSTYDVISNSDYFEGFHSIENIGKKWYPIKLMYQKLFDWKGRRIR